MNIYKLTLHNNQERYTIANSIGEAEEAVDRSSFDNYCTAKKIELLEENINLPSWIKEKLENKY